MIVIVILNVLKVYMVDELNVSRRFGWNLIIKKKYVGS